MLQRGHSGDGCDDLASTLCKYNLRKGDFFVLSCARVRRVRRGSFSSELLMGGGGMGSILLMPLETIDVCIWRMFVFMSVVKVSVFINTGVLKYVVFSVCVVMCGAVGARVWEV